MERRSFIGLTIASVLSLFGLGTKDAKADNKPPDLTKSLSKIAFGSCAEQDRPQPIWNSILGQKPDLFLFIGDNIYADTEDMKLMSDKYKKLGARPEFAKFRSAVPVLAIWDDHDFGINDGGAEYPHKEESKKLMLDFFGEPKDSERRKRVGNYTSYVFGPDGKRTQIIMLDLRWFRSPITWDKKTDGYVANKDPKSTILGAEQWKWLEQELKKPAELRIIVSSIQFSPPDHKWEKWANFPHEKKRLIEMIDKLALKNIFFISGDMHYGELSAEKTPVGFKIYDLTASGMNIFEPGKQYPNRNRIKIHDTSSNFGLIEIDWSKKPVAVSLQVRDNNAAVAIKQDVQYS